MQLESKNIKIKRSWKEDGSSLSAASLTAWFVPFLIRGEFTAS